jgi:glycine oxidase
MPTENPTVWLANLSTALKNERAVDGASDLLPGCDVLVVGGGIVGLATAYFLAERGALVQVIEAESLASGASGANAGGIWPNDQGPSHPAAFQPLAFFSRDLWGRLALSPGFEFDWRVNGFLNVNPEKFAPTAEECARRYQNDGFTVHAVDAEQIAMLEPHLRPGLNSGLHYPSEAHIHPLKAALSFARGIRARKGRIRTGVTATAIKTDGHQVTAVETTSGPISARHVVVCSGWTLDWLAGTIPTLPPLRSVSGQLIATNPQPPLLKGTVGGKFLVLQLKTGEILTGGNLLESSGVVPDQDLSRQFAAAAKDLIPALRDTEFPYAWCGRRPTTPDGLPVIDRAAEFPNLYLACGHFRNGLLLAPATGKLLGDWISTGTRAAELAPFCGDRFQTT